MYRMMRIAQLALIGGFVVVFLLLPKKSERRVAGLASEDVETRRNTASKLGKFPEDAEVAIPVLQAAMANDSDFIVRVLAASSLKRLGEQTGEVAAGPRDIPTMVEGLSYPKWTHVLDWDRAVSDAAYEGLKMYGSLAVPDLLEAIVKQRSTEARKKIMGILSSVPLNRGDIPVLIRVMNSDPSESLRLDAIELIGVQRQQGDVAAEELTHVLRTHPNPKFRRAAAIALGRTGPNAGPVRAALKASAQADKDADCRQAAKAALLELLAQQV